ncbi:MAG: hypothetical protein INF47_09445 [Roseomonas sp.]|nr:hypothetical protein [Roseomonas sp.]
MTPYRVLLSRVGLSLADAATLHDVRLDTVKSWCAGRNPAPGGVIAELRALYARQRRAADEAVAVAAQAPPGAVVELGYAVDDAEALSIGWPCASAQHASLGMVVARLDGPVRLLPRGTTPATAAAADAHDALRRGV